MLPHLYYASNYYVHTLLWEISSKCSHTGENVLFLAGSIVKSNDTRIGRKEKTNYTKYEVTGDLHCISLPLIFRIALQNHKTVPKSVMWYGRLARLRTSPHTSSTQALIRASRISSWTTRHTLRSLDTEDTSLLLGNSRLNQVEHICVVVGS